MYFKIRIIGLLFILLSLVCTHPHQDCQEQEQSYQDTVISYFLEHEEEQKEDFIQVTLTIQKEDASLAIALAAANTVVEDVKKVVISECEKDDSQSGCEQLVDIGNFEIEPKYREQKKQSIFESFKVSHDIVLSIKNSDSIGKIIDSVQNYDINQITKFEWLPEQEQDPMKEALKQGIKKGKVLCKALKLKYKELIEVQELETEEPDEDQEEEDAEDPPLIYKFLVACEQPTKSQKNSQTKKQDKPASKSDAKPAAKSDAKSDAKPAAKSDAKPASKSDAKPAAKTDAKPASKSDAKPATPKTKKQ